MNTDCIFCKIVAGQLPCCKVYEDTDTLAFMDIGPIVPGHTLVIPRMHVDPLMAAPPEVLQKLIVVVQKIARAQLKAFKADGINVIQSNGRAAGQLVPHLHFHVIPRFAADGHHWNWIPRPYAKSEEMGALAEKIRGALE
ncbi:MAG: HIT family protein [Kiritimatiellae bacterium]|nr:HIT family protein [Kiritimatiellia bacterium]